MMIMYGKKKPTSKLTLPSELSSTVPEVISSFFCKIFNPEKSCLLISSITCTVQVKQTYLSKKPCLSYFQHTAT